MLRKIGFFSMFVLVAVATGCTADRPATSQGGASATAEPVSASSQAQTVASQYEGKVVRRSPIDGSKEDGWFFVKDGKRRWITQASWLETQGLSTSDIVVVSSETLAAIPEDPEPLRSAP